MAKAWRPKWLFLTVAKRENREFTTMQLCNKHTAIVISQSGFIFQTICIRFASSATRTLGKLKEKAIYVFKKEEGLASFRFPQGSLTLCMYFVFATVFRIQIEYSILL